ncbi:putative xylogalacturonan beta-1,3-xylosyltransferase [Helianthus anomalus]
MCRSYEIMEQMLKIYIYKDGEKPIFHDWILEGIYACEGWFLKLMEANKQFVTEEPTKAHLFYIPFSSRLPQQTLYVRHSHSRDNLIQFNHRHNNHHRAPQQTTAAVHLRLPSVINHRHNNLPPPYTFTYH